MVGCRHYFINFVRDYRTMADVGRSVLFNDNYGAMPKIIYNKFIPFSGFYAINLFGVIFIREEYRKLADTDFARVSINHEAIHTAQMRELGYILFYVLYFVEWLIRLFTPPMKTAYMDISFEREAYANERNMEYLHTRKHYSEIKYIRNENR